MTRKLFVVYETRKTSSLNHQFFSAIPLREAVLLNDHRFTASSSLILVHIHKSPTTGLADKASTEISSIIESREILQ